MGDYRTPAGYIPLTMHQLGGSELLNKHSRGLPRDDDYSGGRSYDSRSDEDRPRRSRQQNNRRRPNQRRFDSRSSEGGDYGQRQGAPGRRVKTVR